MVKRYDNPRQRARVLKDMPFYFRYANQLVTLVFVLPAIYVFGPPTYHFFRPPPESRYITLDPRREENLSKLRQKYVEREESLKNMSYLQDEK